MRNLLISAALIVSAVASANTASAKEVAVNTAACNYAPANVKYTADGAYPYNIVCVRESKVGYQVISYGVGKDQSIKTIASGKSRLTFNVKTRSLMDGKKSVFSYKGTNIRSAVVPEATKNVVFTAKTPSLGNFADYLNKYSICAQ
jgi:hypothetical protein